MDVWTLLREIREGWPAVRAAKWAVSVGVVLGALIGFGAASLWWTGTVSTLRERLAFSQDKLQIALSGPPSPSSLITKEASYSGRHLSETERACLVSNFKNANSEFLAVIITAFADDEPRKYASEFLILFLRMGYRAGLLEGAPASYDDVGLMIGVKDIDKPSDTAKKFKELIGKCIELSPRHLRFSPPPNLSLDLAAVDFDLFVGPRN